MSAVFASEMITAATSTVAAAAAARQGLATASRRSTRYIHSRSLSSFSKSHTTSRLSGTTIPRSICAQIVSKRRFVSLSLPRHEQQQAKGVPIGHVEPRLSLTFTCTVQDCGHRSTHEFSKRSYEKGIVLVQCPNCKNRHLIADHLSWFTQTPDEPKTVEQMVKEKGGRVRTGRKVLEETGEDQGETIEILSDTEGQEANSKLAEAAESTGTQTNTPGSGTSH